MGRVGLCHAGGRKELASRITTRKLTAEATPVQSLSCRSEMVRCLHGRFGSTTSCRELSCRSNSVCIRRHSSRRTCLRWTSALLAHFREQSSVFAIGDDIWLNHNTSVCTFCSRSRLYSRAPQVVFPLTSSLSA